MTVTKSPVASFKPAYKPASFPKFREKKDNGPSLDVRDKAVLKQLTSYLLSHHSQIYILLNETVAG